MNATTFEHPVTIEARDLHQLVTLACLDPHSAPEFDNASIVLLQHAREIATEALCLECERVQNLEPPHTQRACEDCEDGMTDTEWGYGS